MLKKLFLKNFKEKTQKFSKLEFPFTVFKTVFNIAFIFIQIEIWNQNVKNVFVKFFWTG